MDSTPHALQNPWKTRKTQNTGTYTENTKTTENPEYLYGKLQKTRKTQNTYM